ncbi:glutamine-hydrolyzing carbamoyl-phosphate synthase small subunit [bacterium]|nr:glutamine-hydrolyzing carbamoyl-phosphate synthase small subunit [bacterium]
MTPHLPALLVLEDGSVFAARSSRPCPVTAAEVVFNTSLTGYQEILTDPSYRGQLVTLTMPHIGNTGVCALDQESERIQAAGLLCRNLSPVASSWRAEQGLDDWLADSGVPCLHGLDTRALVLHLREHGSLRGAVAAGGELDPATLQAAACDLPDMTGRNLAREVTTARPYGWSQGQRWWRPDDPTGPCEASTRHVVAIDGGIKRHILRHLAARGCKLTVVPTATAADEILALAPDGVFLSNGPGDPAAVADMIATVKDLLGKRPIFGICLGHQILALALGARTFRLKFGHRGGDHPVRELDTGRVIISAHNHGFAVDPASLPAAARMTHVSLNDGCCEGLEAPALRAFSVQYHPESSPGPHDSDHLFDRFIALIDARQEAHRAHA